jgi:hypothetical protein
MEEMRDVYRAAFLNQLPPKQLNEEEQHALQMLRRFEPLARDNSGSVNR